MLIKKWQNFRTYLLVITFVASLGVALKEVVFPHPKSETAIKPFVFPTYIPLNNWQQIKTIPLKSVNSPANIGQEYQYLQNDLTLTVKGYYQQYTEGNVNRLLVTYTKIPPATVTLQIENLKDIGYYGVYIHNQKAHLSACINPYGETTVTGYQTIRNRYTNGLSFSRSIFWILGQNDLVDASCLWTLMSIPIRTNNKVITIENAYNTLEKAWLDWYAYWRAKFPQS